VTQPTAPPRAPHIVMCDYISQLSGSIRIDQESKLLAQRVERICAYGLVPSDSSDIKFSVSVYTNFIRQSYIFKRNKRYVTHYYLLL